MTAQEALADMLSEAQAREQWAASLDATAAEAAASMNVAVLVRAWRSALLPLVGLPPACPAVASPSDPPQAEAAPSRDSPALLSAGGPSLEALKELEAKHRAWVSTCRNPINPHQATCANSSIGKCEMCAAIEQAHQDFADDLASLLASSSQETQE